MILTLLGTGSSMGVPVIQCKCRVCRSRDLKSKRLRSSAWLRMHGKSFLIDTSPDLRQQALRARIPRVDAVLYTHPHADHVHGIDELRSFNFLQKTEIPVYGNEWTCRELKMKFPYSFNESEPAARGLPLLAKKKEGGGPPLLQLNQFNAQNQSLNILNEKVIPISLAHGSKESVGYRIDGIAYVTDCSYIPASSLNRMKDLSVLVLDCLRLEPHGTHFNLDQALETISIIKPRKTFLTHLGHEIDYKKLRKKIPKGVYFAYDGLTIKA
jgi:phosphoribosyl 1,2-cyclic phosphate phosphodiesterase